MQGLRVVRSADGLCGLHSGSQLASEAPDVSLCGGAPAAMREVSCLPVCVPVCLCEFRDACVPVSSVRTDRAVRYKLMLISDVLHD